MKAKTFEEYIASAPVEHQKRLERLRAIIKKAAPDVVERISYDMPSYHYKGHLMYFGLWKQHIGLYGTHSTVLEKFQKELSGYVVSKGTIQLPLAEPLPIPLITRMVKAMVRHNEETGK